MSFNAAPNIDTGRAFAAERYEAYGKTLPLDSCKVLHGEEAAYVINRPESLKVLDAGDISFDGDMGLFIDPSPVKIRFQSSANSYETYLRVAKNDYESGKKLSIAAAGGADIAAFTRDTTSLEPFTLVTPKPVNGAITNVSTSEALAVAWTGGGDFSDAVIYITARYCTMPAKETLICHVTNDGGFVIPKSAISKLDWANYAILSISNSKKKKLEISELPAEAGWSHRALSFTYIYHDPSADPFGNIICESKSMASGHVGKACTSDGPCGGGCCIEETLNGYFGGGYCSISFCGNDPNVCPADSVCITSHSVAHPIKTYCAKKCADDSDCRVTDGYSCAMASGQKVCKLAFL